MRKVFESKEVTDYKDKTPYGELNKFLTAINIKYLSL